MQRALREAQAFNQANQVTPQPTAAPSPSFQEMMQALVQQLAVANRAGATREEEGPSGSREWKAPTWNGKNDSFRDYLLRLKSSYRARSEVKPKLSRDYYWNTIYDTLPTRERARMRHFWEKGGYTGLKDPEAFFEQLEHIYTDGNEQAKALEKLTGLKH